MQNIIYKVVSLLFELYYASGFFHFRFILIKTVLYFVKCILKSEATLQISVYDQHQKETKNSSFINNSK